MFERSLGWKRRKKSSQTFLLSLFFCRNSVEKHYFIFTFWHYQFDSIRRASLRVVWMRNLSRYYFQDNIIELTSQGERDIIKFQLHTDCVNCTRAPWFCVFLRASEDSSRSRKFSIYVLESTSDDDRFEATPWNAIKSEYNNARAIRNRP